MGRDVTNYISYMFGFFFLDESFSKRRFADTALILGKSFNS